MQSALMSAGERGLTVGRTFARLSWPPPKSVSRPRPGRRRSEQVAAVCYRIRNSRIEFLLVCTRKGRWTFPKGGVELELTLAQTAALEAFEEAGVHGRIEEEPFVRYSRRKGESVKRSVGNVVVYAFLCEVLQLGPPQELNRNRTWFSPEKAKLRLREGRTEDNGAELARTVDRAVARIQRLRNRTGVPDALQRVRFEAAGEDAVKFAVNAYLYGALHSAGKSGQHLDKRARVGAYKPRVIEGIRVAASASQNHQIIEINKRKR